MKRRLRIAFASMLTLVFWVSAGHAAESLHEGLTRLAQDMVYTNARMYPLQATALGLPGHDGELDNPGEAQRAAQIERLKAWQQQLATLSAGMSAGTALVDRDDARLLGAQLARQLNELLVNQTDRKDYGGGANEIVDAVFVQFQHLPVVGQGGATAADQQQAWANITSRLARAPDYIAAAQALATTPCHLFGAIAVQQLDGVPEFMNGALTSAAKTQLGAHSRGYARFAKARDAALAAMAGTRAYISAHLASWPENYAVGREAYDRILKDEQLLPYNATDVETMARDELAHGWAEEAWLASEAKHRGEATAAVRPESHAPVLGLRGQPGLLGPAMREFIARHGLDVGRIVGQQLFVLEYPVVGLAADGIVLRPGGQVRTDVGPGPGHCRQGRVTRLGETGIAARVRAQLRLRRRRERAVHEFRDTVELLHRDGAEQVAGRRRQRLRRGNIVRRPGKAAGDIRPGLLLVRGRGASLSHDRQVLKLHEHGVDNLIGAATIVLSVGLVDEQLVELPRELRPQEPRVVPINERSPGAHAGTQCRQLLLPGLEALDLGGPLCLARIVQFAIVAWQP